MFSSLNCDKLEEKGKGRLESSHMNAQKTHTQETLPEGKSKVHKLPPAFLGIRGLLDSQGGEERVTTDGYSGAKEREDVRPACRSNPFSQVPQSNPCESHFYRYP